MNDLPRNQILVGDAATELARLPAASIDTVISSPPYHLLRNYDAGPDEVGTEEHVDSYVTRLALVMDEVGRVLKPGGSAWLNIGDSYSRHPRYGAPAKSLLLAPARLAIKLVGRGWILRNIVAWTKPNPMPSPVGDRLSATWEPILLLTRQKDYWFDLDAIRTPHRTRGRTKTHTTKPTKYGSAEASWAGPLAGKNDGLHRAKAEGRVGHPLGKNPGDHWNIATAAFRGAHFAVYPETLIERPIKATCPPRVCTGCGQPWLRQLRRDRIGDLHPACECDAGWRPGLVLDPFIGSGTTAVAARRLGRDWLGIELKADYAALARRRIAQTARNLGKAA